MNRLRGAAAGAIVLVAGIAVPLTVVKGAQFPWRHTLVAIWVVEVALVLTWLASAAPVRKRVPYTLVRKDRTGPVAQPLAPSANRRGADAHGQAVALRKAFDSFVEAVLKARRTLDDMTKVPPGHKWTMREEYQLERRRVTSAYRPLRDLFIEFVSDEPVHDLRRQDSSRDAEDLPIDYPLTWWWKSLTLDAALAQFNDVEEWSMQQILHPLHAVLDAFEDWTSKG